MQIPSFLTDEGSDFYQSQMGRIISPQVADFTMEKVSRFFNPDIQQHVLDVACGPGTVSLTLAESYPNLRVTGIDSSSSMIQKCEDSAKRNELNNTQFLVMDANNIELPDSSYDFLICNLAFPFLSDPKQALQGMNRVLKPGGKAAISAPTPNTFQEFFEVAKELVGESVQFIKPFLIKFEKSEVIAGMMEEVGFGDLETSIQRIPFTFPNGQAVLDFFHELFSLLSFVPEEIKSGLAQIIDAKFPAGFTMNYEAVVVQGQRVV